MVKIRYSDEFICPKCGNHTAFVCHTDGTYQAHCMICNVYYDVEIAPITNADCIRSMTDEELAELLRVVGGCGPCHDQAYCKSQPRCEDNCWLDWLRKEASE